MKTCKLWFLSFALMLAYGCGTPELGDQASVLESQAEALVSAESAERVNNDSTVQTCGGKCCRFQCDNDPDNFWSYSPVPVCGACTEHAQSYCRSVRHRGLRRGSPRWGACG